MKMSLINGIDDFLKIHQKKSVKMNICKNCRLSGINEL